MTIHINGKSYEVNSEADINALMERFAPQSEPSVFERILRYFQILNR